MASGMQTIEIDPATADTLKRCAADRGVTVGELIAELVPVTSDAAGIAELDRRWNSVEAGEATVPHDEVARWLETWGTPALRRWRRG